MPGINGVLVYKEKCSFFFFFKKCKYSVQNGDLSKISKTKTVQTSSPKTIVILYHESAVPYLSPPTPTAEFPLHKFCSDFPFAAFFWRAQTKPQINLHSLAMCELFKDVLYMREKLADDHKISSRLKYL